ncbi:formate dehydrogenase subunit gamma [Massilia norwichensis]|uniref:Formate dehydrogenase subunit gamma n=1 Tax=Massilia norwichensis TaxID=1442366 RepID=A0ABT2AAY8_9BURK|nr:formate dehydrogenase subunit gamma [Massilia norwichensis]MCS0591364.1 formate dehydrogenase subunit gamma [Massilia norwichensis]
MHDRHGNPAGVPRDKDGHPLIQRYTANERSNHWFTAILFILLALSGLAMFHPAMAWLYGLFGGGQWTRILHPFFGVLMFVSFMLLALRMRAHNHFEEGDTQWLRQIGDVLANREEKLPKIGKYNAGQKLLFFTLVLCMIVLMLSGIVIWRQWFSHFFPIGLIRFSALMHALFAFIIIMSIIVHIYAGMWIKGSIGAMVRGTVTYGWARKHHPKWFQKVMKEGERSH